MTETQQNAFFATQINQQENQQQESLPQQEQKKVQQTQAVIQQPKQQQKQEEQQKPQYVIQSWSLKELLESFNSYDKGQRGLIGLDQCQSIIAEKLSARQSLSEQVAYYHHLSLPLQDLKCTFDEFLFIFGMCQNQIQKKQLDFQYDYCKSADARLIDFMRLLTNYRKKCQKEAVYQEAKKSKKKVEEIREKQYVRRKNFLNVLHSKQLQELQEKQKEKFVSFCQTWDEFMREYQSTASELVQKLKQKQEQQLAKFVEKTREQLAAKMHYSKQIIQLQALQKNLVKAQQYEKADKVKDQIQNLKILEDRKKQKEDLLKLEMRADTLRKQQISSLNTLLQKIQKDRNDQTRQRMSDAQKLIVKNKTLVTDLKHRHTESLKKLYESLHNVTLDQSRMANNISVTERARTTHNQSLRQNR